MPRRQGRQGWRARCSAEVVSDSGRVRIGCSGWQYAHWRGDFYPASLPVARWLEHYAKTFDTVEINNSFYMLPKEPAVHGWRARTPRGFVFAWKASRFLTHMKKLKDPDEPLAILLSRAAILREKLGPILYQLPPHWPANEERLAAFVSRLPVRKRHVVEMREPSWYAPEIVALLERRRVALCLHDMPGSASPRAVTAPFVYLRFHGADAKYSGGYPERALRAWADWLAPQVRAWLDVYAYFNNDQGGHAPRDAVKLRDLLHRAV